MTDDSREHALKKLLLDSLQRIDELEHAEKPQAEPIAIIGMGCRFPGGANDTAQFWDLLVNSKDAVAEIPLDRWDIDDYYSPNLDQPGTQISRSAALLDVDVKQFDAEYFNISPREAEYMDPQQRILLEVVIEALESAGIAPQSLEKSLTGFFLGIYSHDYADLSLADISQLKGVHPASGGAASIASGRVSFFLNLKGANFSVDTACSSSLVALDNACQYLQTHRINAALVAGVNLILSPRASVILSQAHMLAPDGRCKTFDSRADGFGRGEGCGVVVLKRLSDAQKDNDTILAVIKGSGINQDGASNGLTAPNGLAQEELIQEVCRRAGIKPQEVDFIETHGTGTALGDPIEVRSIGKTYGMRDATNPLVLGAVKSNIGHTESAAGIAGLIKIILMLQHEMIPPNINFKTLNPNITLNFPAIIPTECLPWKKGKQPRRAALSSFAYSGTNSHVIVEEAPSSAVLEYPSGPEIFTLSAKSKPALVELVQKYIHFLSTTTCSLADICYTANLGRNQECFRLALQVSSLDELIAKLQSNQYLSAEVTNIIPHTTPIYNNMNHSINELNELAQAFISGATVNWALFYQSTLRHKVQLPTYPFQRSSYWVEHAFTAVGKSIKSVHPLLGERCLMPDNQIIYKTELSLSKLPYIKDHKVFDFIILPGAAYIEMMLAAARDSLGEGVISVSEVQLEQALNLLPGQPVDARMIVQPHDECFDFSMYSHTEHTWHGHSRALLKSGAVNKHPERLDVDEIKSRNSTSLKIEALYTWLNEAGLQYGPAFQAIHAVNVGTHEVIGTLHTDLSTKEYLAHPVLTDAALQLGAVFFQATGNQASYLPVGCDHIEWYAPWGNTVIALWEEQSSSAHSIRANITVCSDSGVILARLNGVHYRKTTAKLLKAALGKKESIRSLIYEIDWHQHQLPALDNALKNRHWLIVNADHLPIKLKQTFKNALFITELDQPKTKEEFLFLLQNQQYGGIIHCSGVMDTKNRLDIHHIIKSQEYGAKSVLHLVQAMIELQKNKELPLILLTQNRNAAKVIHSPINGLFNTLVQEHPELAIKLIHIEPECNSELLEQAVLADEKETIFLISEQQCYVPRLNTVKIPEQDDLRLSFQSQASYLITGGTGGIGLILAQWLAAQGAGEIILTGRRELNDEIKDHLVTLATEQCTIKYVVLDVGNKQEVSTLIRSLTHANHPLKGIFHLAGVLEDALLKDQDWAHFETVFRSKVYGTFYLHHYSKNLDYFVTFSSVASVLGNTGQSNYAAGNAFMDALCDFRRKQRMHGLSISWGPWETVGMAKDLVSRLSRGGVTGLTSVEGMRALELALSTNQSHVTVAHVDWDIYLKHRLDSPQWLAHLSHQKNVEETLYPQLKSATLAERVAIITSFLVRVVSGVLGMKHSDSLNFDKNLFEMGFDSLMLVELKNGIQTGLGKQITLTSTLVYDHPTVNQLVKHIHLLFNQLEPTVVQTKDNKKAELTTVLPTKWIVQQESLSDPLMRVFCFHHAGGGARVYRGWQTRMPKGVELDIIQLPGREQRINEPLLSDLKSVIKGAVDSVIGYLDRPYIIFAHSLGTVIATEVVNELIKLNYPAPLHMILSGFKPPYFDHDLLLKTNIFKQMNDDEIIHYVSTQYGGIPDVFLNDPQAISYLLPILKADMVLLEQASKIDSKFNIPITTIHNTEDVGFSAMDVAQWQKITSIPIKQLSLPGKHLYIIDNPEPYIDIIKSILRSVDRKGRISHE